MHGRGGNICLFQLRFKTASSSDIRPCALSRSLLYANSFRLWIPAIPPLDAVRTKSGFYSGFAGVFLFFRTFGGAI